MNIAAVSSAPDGMNNYWHVLSYFSLEKLLFNPVRAHTVDSMTLQPFAYVLCLLVRWGRRACFEIMYTQDNERLNNDALHLLKRKRQALRVMGSISEYSNSNVLKFNVCVYVYFVLK